MASERFFHSVGLRSISGVAWLALFVSWPRLTFAVTLLIIGAAMIAFNAMVFWLAVVRGRDAPSVAPIFGGVIAATGVAVLPVCGQLAMGWGATDT
jgi:hypothetical protein